MKKVVLVSMLFLAGCATHRVAERQTQSVSEGETQAVAKMVEILKPFVVELDRDVWTFRYEGQSSFRPTSVADLQKRIAPWALRFYDKEIKSGADVGPGVYVATDPVATATWGGANPNLFAIKIKKGSRILVGDRPLITSSVNVELNQVSQGLECVPGAERIDFREFGQVVGHFRYTGHAVCRSVMIRAFKELGIQALTYGFNSVKMLDCRVTGTAISVVDPSSISLEELNRYSESGRIEGQPAVTPFVQRLFKETQGDYYSQTLLLNREVLAKFKNAFGFFDPQTPVPDAKSYDLFKRRNILKCGPAWSVELGDSVPKMTREVSVEDRQVQNLLVQLAVAYRSREPELGLGSLEFDIRRLKALHSAEFRSTGLPAKRYSAWQKLRAGDGSSATQLGEPGVDFNSPEFLKEFASTWLRHENRPLAESETVKSLVKTFGLGRNTAQVIYNNLRLQEGLVPNLGHGAEQGRAEFMQILTKCFESYSDSRLSMKEVVAGACGLE